MPENSLEREFHAVADLFPLLHGAAFEELVADIKKNGLREPLVCDAAGRIVDGRNRYRACLEAGVEPRFVPAPDHCSLPDLALSLNLRRRHLNESQRALVAGRLAKLLEKKRRGPNFANLQNSPGAQSYSEAAANVNVSPRSVSAAIKVLRDGCAELVAAVESGGWKVSTAAALAGLSWEEQKRAVQGGAKRPAVKKPAAKEPAVNKMAEPPSPGWFQVVVWGEDEEGTSLLRVSHGGLDAAIKALQAVGFHYQRAQA